MSLSVIQGVTFPNQKVSAKDHGALFEKCLTDGIIKGCEISYSGRNVTIGEGYLIVAGREIHLTGANTISLSGSDNHPYVRIKVRIDKGKISSLTTFDQVSFEIDRANTYSGLPSLTKEDINGNGVIYEASMVVLKMTNGAFSSIYSRMQPAVPASGTKAVSVTIPVSAWSSKVANVTVEGITAYTTRCHPIVAPAPASWSSWSQYGIRATSQGTNTLRFECNETPAQSITANVLIIYT